MPERFVPAFLAVFLPAILLAFLRDFAFFVRPSDDRFLFTVAAAISLARRVDRPLFFELFLMCSYWRSSFSLHASGIANPFD